jgi:hypothetical protein
MASATGTVTIDFGAFPGSNTATVTVSGQGSILATSNVEAFFMAESTVDHTANDHKFAALLAQLVCSVPVAATGFDIDAVSTEKLQGTFKLRWVWAD